MQSVDVKHMKEKLENTNEKTEKLREVSLLSTELMYLQL
jgi:hypothetical protein